MSALIQAKNVQGRKVRYVMIAVGDDRRVKEFPTDRRRSKAHDVIAADAGNPRTADISLALNRKSLTPDGAWVDDHESAARSG